METETQTFKNAKKLLKNVFGESSVSLVQVENNFLFYFKPEYTFENFLRTVTKNEKISNLTHRNLYVPGKFEYHFNVEKENDSSLSTRESKHGFWTKYNFTYIVEIYGEELFSLVILELEK
jgi:hypothetical protein